MCWFVGFLVDFFFVCVVHQTTVEQTLHSLLCGSQKQHQTEDVTTATSCTSKPAQWEGET